MKVLFDNCTSPVMAATLDGFVRHEGHNALHVRHLPLKDPKDVDWIGYLAATGDEWLVVTGDQRIRRNKAEAQAFRNARLKAVVLAAPMNRCCAVLIDQWPRLFDTVRRFDPPMMLEMSINFRGNFRQLTV